MKKQVKKLFALLTAGMVLLSSSAVYAAQSPQIAATAAPFASSTSCSIDVISYDVYLGYLRASFYPSCSEGSRFRALSYSYIVEQESGAGSNRFVYVTSGEAASADYYAPIPISAYTNPKEGERIRVRMTMKCSVFNGNAYIKDFNETREFYFDDYTSSQSVSHQLSGSVSLDSVGLSPRQLDASYLLGVSGTDVRFENKVCSYTVEQESGAGTSNFTTIVSKTLADIPANLNISCPVSIKPGEQVRVTITIRADAFSGDFVGRVTKTEEFYFNL